MKRIVFIFFLVSAALHASAQFGVSFHQSSIPFIGFNYEIEDRFLPEARLGTDNFFEDVSFEFTLSYLILKRDNYDFYAGLGGRTQQIPGLVIPVGLNVYPFEEKAFGFHIEMASLLGGEDGDVLRGSWGVRYNFRR